MRALARADEAVDEVLYRPAVVKAFDWLPRWWLCDLAKLSVALDDRWGLGYWNAVGHRPGEACEACGRRAAIHVYGGPGDDESPVDTSSAPEMPPVYVCGWCQLRGRLDGPEGIATALSEARRESVSWSWRWRVRP